MRHLMSPLDFTTQELDRLFDLANDIEHNKAKYAHACDGKILATCFYEPSPRTRLSFGPAWAAASSAFPMQALPPPPRGRACPTPSGLSPATPISAPCAIPRRGRPW